MNQISGITHLLSVMEKLRLPGGCPWDREQTHQSIASCAIEEAYELFEALLGQDDAHICEELGDVLLQVVFHAQIAKEQGRFDFDEIAEKMAQKLVSRHPHVFTQEKLNTSEEVKVMWEEIKKKEKGKEDRGILGGIQGLPPLLKAEKIQKKAAKVGFDWETWQETLSKMEEEIAELEEAQASGREENIQEELGDLFFTLVNLSRKLNMDPHVCLEKSNQKFIKRFGFMEKKMSQDQRKPQELTPQEWDYYWREAKKRKMP